MQTRKSVCQLTVLALVVLFSSAQAFAQATPTPNPGKQDNAVKAYNAHSPPGAPPLGKLLLALWDGRESGGGLTPNTTGVDVAAIVARVNGVDVSKAAATAQAVTTCGNTTATQFRKCTLCMDVTGTLRFTPGNVVTTNQAAALKPYCADTETEIAYLELPTSFTAGATTITAGMCKQAATRMSAIDF